MITKINEYHTLPNERLLLLAKSANTKRAKRAANILSVRKDVPFNILADVVVDGKSKKISIIAAKAFALKGATVKSVTNVDLLVLTVTRTKHEEVALIVMGAVVKNKSISTRAFSFIARSSNFESVAEIALNALIAKNSKSNDTFGDISVVAENARLKNIVSKALGAMLDIGKIPTHRLLNMLEVTIDENAKRIQEILVNEKDVDLESIAKIKQTAMTPEIAEKALRRITDADDVYEGVIKSIALAPVFEWIEIQFLQLLEASGDINVDIFVLFAMKASREDVAMGALKALAKTQEITERNLYLIAKFGIHEEVRVNAIILMITRFGLSSRSTVSIETDDTLKRLYTEASTRVKGVRIFT